MFVARIVASVPAPHFCWAASERASESRLVTDRQTLRGRGGQIGGQSPIQTIGGYLIGGLATSPYIPQSYWRAAGTAWPLLRHTTTTKQCRPSRPRPVRTPRPPQPPLARPANRPQPRAKRQQVPPHRRPPSCFRVFGSRPYCTAYTFVCGGPTRSVCRPSRSTVRSFMSSTRGSIIAPPRYVITCFFCMRCAVVIYLCLMFALGCRTKRRIPINFDNMARLPCSGIYIICRVG